MKTYQVIQTYSAAVNLLVDADSEDEVLEKAEEMIASGAITNDMILESIEPEDLYVK